jgi:hypothetical protein
VVVALVLLVQVLVLLLVAVLGVMAQRQQFLGLL